MEVIIITGMSGAGKSQAIDCLEDKNYYCVDNMPPALMENFITLANGKGSNIDKVAFVLDVRGDVFGGFDEALKDLKDHDTPYKIIFLEASDEVILRRYNETRRVYPVTKETATLDDIKKEREDLAHIRQKADFIIDTSSMKAAQLKQELLDLLADEYTEETFVINVMSTGNSKKVRNFVMRHLVTQMFIKDLDSLVNNIIPCYMKEGKYNLNIAFGCTGGQHRSVAMANEFAERFELQGKQVTLEHRDIRRK